MEEKAPVLTDPPFIDPFGTAGNGLLQSGCGFINASESSDDGLPTRRI